MTSQLVIFRAFFIFLRPSDPKSEKNPLNQLKTYSGLSIRGVSCLFEQI